MKLLPLSKGKMAVVSDEDYEYCSRFQWSTRSPRGRSKSWYAFRNVKYPGTRDSFCIYLHREIMMLKSGDKDNVDHINGDGLDNRRENLRLCNQSQNGANSRKGKGRGVYFDPTRPNKPWVATLMKARKHIFLGAFPEKEDALKAYDAKAVEIFGEFAQLNYPNE